MYAMWAVIGLKRFPLLIVFFFLFERCDPQYEAIVTLGPGWGSFIRCSYLRFHAGNILCQFLHIPAGLTFMKLLHFWSLIFFMMLFVAVQILVILQLISVLMAMFDEWERFRSNKQNVILESVAILALSSVFFCSRYSLALLTVLSKSVIVTQMILNLLLIVIVLWVYGRERFQRDVLFMTGQSYSKLKVYLVRFVAPLFIIVGLLAELVYIATPRFNYKILFPMILLGAIPWCLIPSYCIHKFTRTDGGIGVKLKKSVTPKGWYPADPVYSQRYREVSQDLTGRHLYTTYYTSTPV